MKRNILLLTATIKPRPDQPQLKLINVEERLKDYELAMEFYSRQLEMGALDKIIFVDNSGYDLSSLSSRFQSTNIEWISFFGLDYPNSFHRGYGEFRLIDHAFLHSTSLRTLGDDDVVWKVTGRYIIDNIVNVINLAPKSFDLYCDIKNKWVGMELMAWSKTGYETLIKGVWQKFATEMAPELVMANFIMNNAGVKTNKIIVHYYWPPFILGRRGFDGGNFNGRYTKIKFGFTLVLKLAMLPIRFLFIR